MKVFELMNVLAGMPAGAEVEFSTMMTIPELIKNGVACSCDDGEYYQINAEIVEVEKSDASGKVILYQ